jgi:hypothetical protein
MPPQHQPAAAKPIAANFSKPTHSDSSSVSPEEVPEFKICQKCPDFRGNLQILEDLFFWNGLTPVYHQTNTISKCQKMDCG